MLRFLYFPTFQRVFELHGAVQVHVPQLLPRSSLRIYDRTDKLVTAMSKSGDVVCLPFDLRVPFARSEKYHYIKVARPVLKSM
jgi:histidyl-tRNA synthetase